MWAHRGRIGIVATALLLALPAGARATVIGSLDPSTKDPGPGDYCVGANANYLQPGIAPGDPTYTVPAGGGTITSWSTKFGTPGDGVGLEVWRSGIFQAQYTLVALDSELIAPNAQGITTYSVSIPVEAGDVIGMTWPTSNTIHCAYTPHPDNINRFTLRDFASIAVGTTVNFNESDAVFGDLLDLTATLQQDADLSVSQTLRPANARPGAIVQFLFNASNAGPAPSPATLSDTLPSGLKAISAVAQNGSCTLGTTVSCQLSEMSPGTSSAVVINAQAVSSGNYTNSATISGDPTNVDPNLANNKASASGTVLPQCIVPKLKGHTLSKAKKLLSQAHCALGKVTKPKHHKGKLLVASQSPAAGSVETAGTPVAITLAQKKK